MGGVLCEFPDVFSKSKTGFKFLLLEKFRDSVPEGSAAITSRPHHINAIIAKKVDIISDQYLAADLIYCSTLDLSGLDSLGKGRVFSLFDVVFLLVRSDDLTQRHRSPHRVLHSHWLLLVARHAQGQHCFVRLVRQGNLTTTLKVWSRWRPTLTM